LELSVAALNEIDLEIKRTWFYELVVLMTRLAGTGIFGGGALTESSIDTTFDNFNNGLSCKLIARS
jgi:hypothetical protein